MPNKHCVFSDCRSDSRYYPNLKWASFVKPTKTYNVKRAIRWVHLVGRSDFTISNITKDTWICEKHFPPGVVLDWSKNVELEPFPKDKNIDFEAHDYSEVVEKVAVNSWVAKNIQKIKHSKKKDVTIEETLEDAAPILNQCGVCDKKLNNLLELNIHMKSEHSMGLQKFDIEDKDYSRIHENNKNSIKTSLVLPKENPWQIQSIYDLRFYICPVCRYTNWSKQAFVIHATNAHPEAIENFKNISDGSLNDIDCPWRLESIDIKEEIIENDPDSELIDIKEENFENPERFIQNIMIKVDPLDLDNAIDKITKETPINNAQNNNPSSMNILPPGSFSHKCEVCGLLLQTEHSLKKHMQSRHHEKSYHQDKIDLEMKQQSEIHGDKLEDTSSSTQSYCKNAFYRKDKSSKISIKISQSSNDPIEESSEPEINEEQEEDFEAPNPILNQCGICDGKFDNLMELNNHMKSEHSMGSRQKFKFDKKFFNSRIIPMKNENLKTVKCVQCDAKFTSHNAYTQMKKHFRSVHANLETLECLICQIVSLTRQKLIKHINLVHMQEEEKCSPKKLVHKKGEKSPKKLVVVHKKSAAGYKPSPKTCEYCGRTFSTTSPTGALKRHIDFVHRGFRAPKDSVCDECGKVMSKDSLSSHRKSHLPIEQRPFECETCGLRFNSELILKRHIDRVHKRIMNKVCQYCQKAFYDEHGLNKHINHVHLLLKPYKCPKCGKGMHSSTTRMIYSIVRTFNCDDFYLLQLCLGSFTDEKMATSNLLL